MKRTTTKAPAPAPEPRPQVQCRLTLPTGEVVEFVLDGPLSVWKAKEQAA